MREDQQTQTGLGILELLVSIALSGIILSALIVSIHGSYHVLTAAQSELQVAAVKAKLSQLLREISRETSLQSLSSPPRIHRGGSITFRSGIQHPLLLRSDRLAPSQHSDAISSVELIFKAYLKVIGTKRFGNHVDYLACPVFPDSVRAKDPWNHSTTENFVGIGVDGIVELSGQVRPAAKNGCFEFQLKEVTQSMTSHTPSLLPLEMVRGILPIKRSYTIYLDRANILRFVSHRGDKITENQPLLSGVGSLRIAHSSQQRGSLSTLEMKFKLTTGAKGESSFLFSAPSLDRLELLFALGGL